MGYRKDEYRKGDLNAVEITQIGIQKLSLMYINNLAMEVFYCLVSKIL